MAAPSPEFLSDPNPNSANPFTFPAHKSSPGGLSVIFSAPDTVERSSENLNPVFLASDSCSVSDLSVPITSDTVLPDKPLPSRHLEFSDDHLRSRQLKLSDKLRLRLGELELSDKLSPLSPVSVLQGSCLDSPSAMAATDVSDWSPSSSSNSSRISSPCFHGINSTNGKLPRPLSKYIQSADFEYVTENSLDSEGSFAAEKVTTDSNSDSEEGLASSFDSSSTEKLVRCFDSEKLSIPSLCSDLLAQAQLKHTAFYDPFIVKAFYEAARAHHGQCLPNGDPYLFHCTETALILAEARSSKPVVAAGLLHDTLYDSPLEQSRLRDEFSDDVANLVEGVSRLSELSQLARNDGTNFLELDHLQSLLLAMVDVRVVFIKLADRLHNMRTLEAFSAAKQREIANETLEIFVPLANRLGICSWKAEMEDLCFMYLNPEEHHKLRVELSKKSRDFYVISALRSLDKALQFAGIPFHDLCGRTKSLYSIYLKMTRKSRTLKEIFDVRGLRVIVPDVVSCFDALRIIHDLWPRIPGKQKDYINHPKHNGYQSLHTTVEGEDGFPLEVQIRTLEMHHNAEFGMAAHWRYKEGDSKYSKFITQRVEWARWVLTWHTEVVDTKLRVSPLGLDLRPPQPFPSSTDCCNQAFGLPEHEQDIIYIILMQDEKVVVQELPFGSTARDLLTRVRPNGLNSWKEIRLVINHRAVKDFDQKLSMGDMVELKPFVSEESRNKCRHKIRRMYEDTAMQRILDAS